MDCGHPYGVAEFHRHAARERHAVFCFSNRPTTESTALSIPIVPNGMDLQKIGLASVTDKTHNMRTYFDIVWSCLSTLFICTWVAIHPNIPPRGEGNIRALGRKIKLMLWTLVVPELMLMWAYRQWSAARAIAEYFQDVEWTPTHGHFLIMGGFTYFDGEVEIVLDFDQFCRLLGSENSPPQISFPTSTAADIQDKARGDFLSKAIVVLQSLWFIVNCIARRKQGLALTELELVTLALATLNGPMYYFWWNKPLGVNEPITLYRKSKEPPEKSLGDWQQRRERFETASQQTLIQSLVLRPLQALRSLQILKDFKAALFGCRPQVSTIHQKLSSISFSTFIDNQRNKLNFPGDLYLWPLYLPIMWVFVTPIVVLFKMLFATATTKTLKSGAAHVPTFYAPYMRSSLKYDDVLLYVVAPIAAAFGSLHCIAWNFEFPSHTERLLWRIGSLAITIIPVVPLVCYILLFLLFDRLPRLLKFMRENYGLRLSNPFPKALKKFLGYTLLGIGTLLGGAGLLAYVVARLLLLVQAVVLLRKQPESAFYAINWSYFLPHI